MFIVTPAGVPKDGTAPCLQYGYGGFSHSMDPFFSPEMLTFIKQYGARLAVANIRGGSEQHTLYRGIIERAKIEACSR